MADIIGSVSFFARFVTEPALSGWPGFDVRMDETMDNGFRWLTVAAQCMPPEQRVE